MTRDQAVNRIQQLLGFRDDLSDEVQFALTEAQEDLESGVLGTLPWFLAGSHRWDFMGVPQEPVAQLALPEDFIRENQHHKQPVWTNGNLGQAIRVDAISPDGKPVGLPAELEGTGRPVYSYEPPEDPDDTLGFYPNLVLRIPTNRLRTTGAQVTLQYFRRDFLLDQDIENLWLRHASLLMIGLAGTKMAGVRDANARNQFEQMEARGREALFRSDAAFRVRRSGEPGVIGTGITEPLYHYNDTDLGR